MGERGGLIPKFLPRVISKPCAKINSANFWLQWWGGAGSTEVLVKKFKNMPISNILFVLYENSKYVYIYIYF
jgi:uncharacterized protein (DUF1919 family)